MKQAITLRKRVTVFNKVSDCMSVQISVTYQLDVECR